MDNNVESNTGKTIVSNAQADIPTKVRCKSCNTLLVVEEQLPEQCNFLASYEPHSANIRVTGQGDFRTPWYLSDDLKFVERWFRGTRDQVEEYGDEEDKSAELPLHCRRMGCGAEIATLFFGKAYYEKPKNGYTGVAIIFQGDCFTIH